MMLGPESYYQENLKDKDSKQIMTVIRSLKNEMGHLKNTMEHPDYGTESVVMPDELTRLWCARMYLDRAKEALVEAGSEYKPSKTELTAIDFEENVFEISTIKFSIGGYFGGYETHTITLTDDKLLRYPEHSIIPKPMDAPAVEDDPVSKEEFLETIRNLHMGEWRRSYNTRRFGYVVCDGTQWEIEIGYRNGHKPVKFSGDNAYPYNFHELEELFGINNDLEEDENDE